MCIDFPQQNRPTYSILTLIEHDFESPWLRIDNYLIDHIFFLDIFVNMSNELNTFAYLNY